MVTGRCSGEDTDAERPAGGMFFFGTAGNGFGNHLGSSCGSKSAKAHVIIILYMQSGLFGRNYFKTHSCIVFLIFPI